MSEIDRPSGLSIRTPFLAMPCLIAVLSCSTAPATPPLGLAQLRDAIQAPSGLAALKQHDVMLEGTVFAYGTLSVHLDLRTGSGELEEGRPIGAECIDLMVNPDDLPAIKGRHRVHLTGRLQVLEGGASATGLLSIQDNPTGRIIKPDCLYPETTYAYILVYQVRNLGAGPGA